jgi:predicted NUDIX family NTP pyrophosphohydrolase
MSRVTTKRSAGLLVYRRRSGQVEVFLGHLGGPLWARREPSWSIPKGEPDEGEELFDTARREFVEETGLSVPEGEWLPLGEWRQPNGKVVTAWAVAGDLDADAAVSNTFTMEWPPRSGRIQEFPELDRFAWADVDTAPSMLIGGQQEFLTRLLGVVAPSA